MITIREIAKKLGVSPTTVSNVINGKTGKMSDETRHKVEEALIRNHYVHERKNKDGEWEQKLIAVYFCLGTRKHVLTDPFCGSFLEGIERELRAYDRAILCGTVGSNEEFEDKLRGSNIEGGILLGCEPDNCTTLLAKMNKPVVFVDSGDGEYDNIGLQDLEGACELTSYLIRQGHKKIAFLSDQKAPIASNLERLKGYQLALERFGMNYDEKDYFFLPLDENLRYEVLRQFAGCAKEKGYTACFFVSDYLANEGINVFFSQNLSVPGDISVAGFDDNIYARLSRPMLTTVRQSPEEKGQEAVRLLMKRIYGKEVLVRNLHLQTELIVRDSVRSV
jgi:LacI family transcriptional regulator